MMQSSEKTFNKNRKKVLKFMEQLKNQISHNTTPSFSKCSFDHDYMTAKIKTLTGIELSCPFHQI